MAAYWRNTKRLYRFQVSFSADAGTESGLGGTRRDDPVRRRLCRSGTGREWKCKFGHGGDQAPFRQVRKTLGWLVGRHCEGDAAACRTIGRSSTLLAAAFIHLWNSLRLRLSCTGRRLESVKPGV